MLFVTNIVMKFQELKESNVFVRRILHDNMIKEYNEGVSEHFSIFTILIDSKTMMDRCIH